MNTRKKLAISATWLLSATPLLHAGTFGFSFAGPGVSGTIDLTYGAATDAKYPQAFEVTGITGTFSDSNKGLGIVNVPLGTLLSIRHDTPDPTNLLAPHDFSRFAVASGLSAQSNGVLTYDNLYWPGGSPQTASSYAPHGGFLDIYGLMFNIGDNRVVDLWSNGEFSGHIDYGVAVATADTALDYVSSGVSITPEPSAGALLGAGLLAIAIWRRAAARSL